MNNYPDGFTASDYAYVNGEHMADDCSFDAEENHEETEPLSDCCGAQIKHTDICTECLEHCEVSTYVD